MEKQPKRPMATQLNRFSAKAKTATEALKDFQSKLLAWQMNTRYRVEQEPKKHHWN